MPVRPAFLMPALAAARRWAERRRARLPGLAAAARERLGRWGVAWLTAPKHRSVHLSPINFARLEAQVRPGDVLLIEGRTRVAHAIRAITHSVWTHSALVVGRLADVRDPALRAVARAGLRPEERDAPLLVESELGRGTFVSSLLRYRDTHLRLCRPRGLGRADARRVATYALLHVGWGYDMRQILDLARFLVPWWAVVPRRWHSSLFAHNHQQATLTICSTMIAQAFHRVRFPVMPVVVQEPGGYRLLPVNSRLVTPRDFDHSPYFEVIKYPLLDRDDIGFYRRLPWSDWGVVEAEARRRLDSFDRLHARPPAGAAPEVDLPAAPREGPR